MQVVQLAAEPSCPDGETEFYIRKQRASTSPSLPVAVSGSVSPREAPAQIGRFWFRHHCFVQERHGLEGLSGMSRRRMVEFLPKHIPVISNENKKEIRHSRGHFSVVSVGADKQVVPTFAETCGLPLVERGGCWELAIPHEYGQCFEKTKRTAPDRLRRGGG
jgi:hypothetical protein